MDTKFLINLRKEQSDKFFGQSLYEKGVLAHLFILVWDYKKLHLNIIKSKSGRLLPFLAHILMNQKTMKTDVCLMMITSPCCSTVLDYKGHSSTWKHKVFPFHNILGFWLLMRNKVSWNEVRSNFVYSLKENTGSP